MHYTESTMNTETVQPRPASTIILLRQQEAGFGVFLVVRHHQVDFATGAAVFPGGRLHADDHDPFFGGDQSTAAELSPSARAHRVAAIRETYEEAGLLLAYHSGSRELASRETLERLERLDARGRLERGELTLREVLEQERLELALDALAPFAHWITPHGVPKRFDTHFYLAAAPEHQLASHGGREVVDSVWLSPQQALDQARSKRLTIIFPTLMNLNKLTLYQSAAHAIEASRQAEPVTVQPQLRSDPDTGRVSLEIPAEAGYPPLDQDLLGF